MLYFLGIPESSGYFLGKGIGGIFALSLCTLLGFYYTEVPGTTDERKLAIALGELNEKKKKRAESISSNIDKYQKEQLLRKETKLWRQCWL